MSKERYLNTKFWDDSYIIKKDPIEKLLFIYLLTNPLTNIIGIYEISIDRIAFDTGIEQEMVLKILKRFEKDMKIKYKSGYIALKNFTKHQKNNPKINRGIELLIKEVPQDLVKWVDIDYDRLSEDSQNYLEDNKNTAKYKPKKKIEFDYKSQEWKGITEEDRKTWKKINPNCNIEVELLKMAQWLLDNPKRRKKRYRSFITNWVSSSGKNGRYVQSNTKDNQFIKNSYINFRKGKQ